MTKKPNKVKNGIITALVCLGALSGVAFICLLIFCPSIIGAGILSISSLFAKKYNDEQLFSTNGLFIYENNGEDDVEIEKLEIFINEYQGTKNYDIVFKNSKNNEYGINFEITTNDNIVNDYTKRFLNKQKSLRSPNHYTYLYFFEFHKNDEEIKFSLEARGEKYLALSYVKPITSYYILENKIKGGNE